MNGPKVLNWLGAVVLSALVISGCGSAASPYTGLSASEIERFAASVDRLSGDDVFSGAVLVAKDGDPIFTRAYGLADKEANIPNLIDTKFNIGSLNKTFTAVAVAQLSEQGKLAFSDPIRKHLPDYPDQKVADTVTIHHLLLHTSGLPSEYSDPNDENWYNRCCFSDHIRLFADVPLAFPPGENWQYSNADTIVLGAIIEQASGQDYFDYVRQHIYEPAGMTNTDSYERDQEVVTRAIGYTGPLHTTDARNRTAWKGDPAGGGYSTVEDLLKFQRALLTHRLLSPEITELVLTPLVDRSDGDGSKATYAGFVDEQNLGTHTRWNAGQSDGGNATFVMYVTSGHTLIVLSNYDAPAAYAVADEFKS